MSLPSDTAPYYLPTDPADTGWVRAAWPGAVIGVPPAPGSGDNAVELLLRNAHSLWTSQNSAILAAVAGITYDGVETPIHEIDNSGGGSASSWEVALSCEVQLVSGRTDLSFHADYEGGAVRARVYDSGGAVGSYVTLPTSSSRTQDSDLLDAAGADPDTCYVQIEVQADTADIAYLYNLSIREQWP
jgi:hypothetical protein